MNTEQKLRVGDMSENGQVTIVDEDRLCYLVKSEFKGARGLRTISKSLLKEFVNYAEKHPDAKPRVARDALSGMSEIDKYEYGYDSTLLLLANMVLGNTTTIHKETLSQKQPKEIAVNTPYRPYITAIKSKPFVLLAGISGTGKSRIVRELARACWEEGTPEYKPHKPRNFEMIQVKPNWHDSSELIGYVSRVSGEPVFVAGEFLKFIARAWENEDVPHFLCLDEMNLAPVEQYFAEYLSVIESRKNGDDGKVVTDAIVKKEAQKWYWNLCNELTADEDLRVQFRDNGITLPKNLIVVGTVNMDETTFSFSRKVLDRAMTIEMNEVDLGSGLDHRHERIGLLGEGELIGTVVEGVDVYEGNREVCDVVISYLKAINERLENTPFKIAYRTRNEALLYVVNNLPYNKAEDGTELPQAYVIARALDEITNMKVLSRIEGDETKISTLLSDLEKTIDEQLTTLSEASFTKEESVSLAKLKEMEKRLKQGGYTSFWS